MNRIVVCGAGTMGSGIAETIARSGFSVILFDPAHQATERAEVQIRKNLAQLLDKQKITVTDLEEILSRMSFTAQPEDCVGDLVIEAIIEELQPKKDLFATLARINAPQTILASNTSSLSLRNIAEHIPAPERFCGMHFFNPAPLMKLVEVIRTPASSQEMIDRVIDFTKALGKVPVLCQDSPGFIVNRVARHYYLEAMQAVEDGMGDFTQIDRLLENAGFRMGPFKLMDLIGNDINYTVTNSLYQAFHQAHRFRPSPIQEEKIRNGELGRKTGKGYFTY